MKRVPVWVFFFFLCCSPLLTDSIDEDVRSTLINFFGTLSGSSNDLTNSSIFNWTVTTDPCWDNWNLVQCDRKEASVTQLRLDRLNLSGTLDFSSLCNNPYIGKSLSIVTLDGNNVSGEISADISNCRQLTQLHVSGNRLSGDLPGSLASLNNLRKLDFSFNNFSGKLPEKLGRISGLQMFLAQNNQFIGKIPKFDFSNLIYFNVSYNNLTGRIPDGANQFKKDSFLGNPSLCGSPLTNECLDSGSSTEKMLLYSGYALVGLVVVGIIIYKIFAGKKKKNNNKMGKSNPVKKEDDYNNKNNNSIDASTEYTKSNISKQETSSTSLVVLTSPTVNGLRFEDLLAAPAELLGRGKHGSLYKVVCENGMSFAVKRIKDWAISSENFKKRMQRIGDANHRNVLPVAAFYASKQEKLLVYEFQPNGSLFRLLHGIQQGHVFEWVTRLNVAASVAEALAFMHQKLGADIPHGNLKSTNILFNKDMDPCISEYGLMASDNNSNYHHQDSSLSSSEVAATIEGDIYGFGVILLELLTGKLVQNVEFDLAKWVHSVVREEWTVEVFDKSLVREGASEDRMVDLLQVAIRCVDPAAGARPSIGEVVTMINSIKEEEDRSIAFEP